MGKIDKLQTEVKELEKRVDGLTKLINNIFKQELDRVNSSTTESNTTERKRERMVEGTSKLIIDKTAVKPYIFIARRNNGYEKDDNTVFIDNKTRDMFFTDCKKLDTPHNERYRYSITIDSPDYEKWRKLFV